ncbi:MAG: DNA cytosine methyltransferase [Mesorhizobium sp.]|nr:MAG: DNA cytosine methyltransferase [Mesorhizobium sp.]
MARPVGIDLFAGVGGMSLGFEQAGFDVRAAVEIDPIHSAVHKFNFPDCAVIPRSVVGLSAAQVKEAAGLASDDRVDAVFGGPPCQGFSMIGHRAIEDPRNRLVLEFVRLVAELDASYFVFENVKGLTVGRHRTFLDELVKAFRAYDYDVRLPWQVFDTASFGVPQHRQRLILIGAKKGLAIPPYPPPKTRAADERRNGDLPVGPTARDALGDLPDADTYECLKDGDSVQGIAYGKPSRFAAELRCLTNDSWHYGHPRKWDPTVLTSSWRTDHTEISRQRFNQTRGGGTEPISRFYKLRAEGLSNTLRAGTDSARGAFTSPRPIHYEHARCVTVREMARLHGFPDWFRMHSTKWHGARQIGNAVPPPLARAIAAEIVRTMGVEPTRPRKAIVLGDEALLYTTVAQAAEQLGVEPPNQRRDRQSGAKKRTQHETEAARLAALETTAGG